jgi:hypothetical protein
LAGEPSFLGKIWKYKQKCLLFSRIRANFAALNQSGLQKREEQRSFFGGHLCYRKVLQYLIIYISKPNSPASFVKQH